MSRTPQEVLWRPDSGLPEEDLARRPSTHFKLCEVCRGALASPDVLQTSRQMPGNISLCGGTPENTQCSLRTMLLDHMEKLREYQQEHSRVERIDWPDYWSKRGILTKYTRSWLGETVLEIRPDSPGSPIMLLRIQAYLDDPASEIISSRPFLACFGSEEGFKQMRQWMAECERSHPGCGNGLIPAAALPSRVIDVQTLRLHESSHGDTLKDTIRLESLPQTIRDAIFVTQNLGLKYIWIDAYCIIQDNAQDKQKELAHMAEIYSQAYVTLSGSSAANVHEGFLYKRKPRERGMSETWPYQYPRIVVPFHLPDREGIIGNAVLQVGQADDVFPRDPIMSRAWTFQEGLLSRRILYFGAHELYWQCNGAQRGCGAFEWKGEFNRPRFLSRKHPVESVHIEREWMDLVTEFTRRDITHEEDRLVALAALASRFSEAHGGKDAYIAGLWRSSIRRYLLWAPITFPWEPKNSRPSVYVAPSWSWASVKCWGGVGWRGEDASRETDEQGQAYVEILECVTTLKSTELPFGQITGGKIRIRGPFRPELQDLSPTLCSKEEHDNWNNPSQSVDIVAWDVDSEALDLDLMFHVRVMDRFGLVLVSQQAGVFERVGLSEFASSQNADNFFALSISRDIELI